ncbi:MAG: hypothetical protein AAFO80_08190 [Pseudomonadota bacterium]
MFEPMIYVVIAVSMSIALLALVIRAVNRRRSAPEPTDYTEVLNGAMTPREKVTVQKYKLSPGDNLRLERQKTS